MANAAKLSEDTANPPSPGSLRQLLTSTALPFVIGGFSGMVATTFTQPIDMVKVRMQLAGEGVRDAPRPNPFSVARTIVAQGKILDLYSGLSAGLLRQSIYATSRLGFFDTFINILKERTKKKGTEIGFGERALAGIAAGGLGAMIGNPADLVLIRMQSDGSKPKEQRANYRSVFDALARISKNEGISALWKGAYPTVVRAMSTNFGQLAFFSESKNQIQQHTTLSPRTQTFAASAIAGFFAAFCSLPFDFVKTRLQKQRRAPDGSAPYKGMMDCFVKAAKNEGLLRFYRGFGTYLFRIVPHSVVTLIVADYIWSFVG
ncbi:mitochondrial dicarboxylate carrier protein [Mytilinidion resinicola]|uniref:Mitochondrial dicarboxylate carrier protein n=1 Tax=Mytilinidion resinicola TaxID=574789 RepID=A0A6A6YFW0_9PEZI|nr:mitochondrial dicarboxylate carrier protein [Mytilinidion resinicola]KAF2806777.1 mitochondrial dicarboxylate carrier protein [Mytilinidion resinicola]